MVRSRSWHLPAAAALVVLLAALATLQYRWLGEVSNAERERLRSSLRARTTAFTLAFDRELTRAYSAFHFEADRFSGDEAGSLADAFNRARVQSAVGGIISTVFLVDPSVPSALRRLDPEHRTLAPSAWPPSLDAVRRRLETPGRRALPPLPGLADDAIDPDAPALVVPLALTRQVRNEGGLAIVAGPVIEPRSIVLELDGDKLRRQVIPGLVDEHFGADAASEYDVRIVSGDDAARVIYQTTTAGHVTPKTADFSAGLFDLRIDELLWERRGPGRAVAGDLSPPEPVDHVAITFVRRARVGEPFTTSMAGDATSGAWRVLVQAKGGSLDALVERSRRRNLTVGLGILGLLGASVMLLTTSTRREQRLARQQMEFVAAVSHELRTPLAVIRSAGENLADGLVTGPQIAEYGTLIRLEGRRLSEMVERVMDFAGLSAGATLRTRRRVPVSEWLSSAVAAVSAEARERGVSIAVSAGPGSAEVVGDPDALRSALQNAIGNAVKYSPAASAVEITASPHDGLVRVRVADHGIGIDPHDLPHVFKPFYRGRRAIDSQTRGSGVGLSVVRQVIEAHHGHVSIESRVGAGTTLTIDLPAATANGGQDTAGAPTPA